MAKSKDENELKARYKKARKLQNYSFLLILLASPFLIKQEELNQGLILLMLSVLGGVPAGIVVFLYYRLPKRLRKSANWFSLSVFNIHPNVTFIIFAILFIISLLDLL